MQRLFISLSLAVVALTALLVLVNAGPSTRKVPPGPGTLSFTGKAGWEAKGTFANWEFTELLVPQGDFSQVRASIRVDMKSVQIENKDLQKHLLKGEYFGVKRFPEAFITLSGATLTADQDYTSTATITIKGISQEIPLRFSVSESAPYHLRGTGELNRQLFKINGKGPEDTVPIGIDVVLAAQLYTSQE